jgi:DNA modification methylase
MESATSTRCGRWTRGGGAIRRQQEHPTQKPVELFLRPIRNHTRVGEVVYEPFAGSGSQVIAAERTQRRCRAIEISARYCDVILRRWEAETGKVAERVSGAVIRAEQSHA